MLEIELGVSIHAPREGCDCRKISQMQMLYVFQFTHPGRGATDAINGDMDFPRVSIHAPREGCDFST